MFLLSEIIEIIITIIIAGYILMPLTRGNIKNSIYMSSLSIVLHELGHKFVAIASGFTAVYHANFSGLIFGLILRLLGAPVFFVPAYVQVSGSGPVIGFIMTALAGPLMNLLVFGTTTIMIKHFSNNEFIQDNALFINQLRVINLWLALINLLPIPGTDGYNALMSLRAM